MSIGEQDGSVLLRLVIVLEGRVLAGQLDDELVRDLHRQFERAGLIGEASGSPDAGDVAPAQLRLALANLNQRLRYAIGEYDEPPEPDLGWTNHFFRFTSVAAAERFLAEARAIGERGAGPELEPSAAVGPHCLVEVTIEDLPMTAAFEEHVRRLIALAGQHGGQHQGWGATDAR